MTSQWPTFEICPMNPRTGILDWTDTVDAFRCHSFLWITTIFQCLTEFCVWPGRRTVISGKVKDESWWTWPTGGVRLQPWGEEHLHQCSLPEHDWDYPRGASWPRMDLLCPPRWLARKSKRFKCCSWSQFCPCVNTEDHRLALTIPNISEVWNPGRIEDPLLSHHNGPKVNHCLWPNIEDSGRCTTFTSGTIYFSSRHWTEVKTVRAILVLFLCKFRERSNYSES